MRPPRTANDDHPGPTGRRHSATGGDAVQSVLMRTPGTISSRWGPRKPGQSGAVPAPAGTDGTNTGSLPARATSRLSEVLAAAGPGGIAAGSRAGWATGSFSGDAAAGASGSATASLPDWAMSRSSGVFAHRQCKSLRKLLAVKPPVRTSAHPPHASRMVATIDTRRGPSGRRRVAIAHATKGRPRKVSAKMGNNIPCAPVAIDTSTMRFVANSATIISPTAPTRSDQGARLRNNHQRMTANPPTGPANTPMNKAPGAKTGTPNRTSNCRITMTTPGHSRSGFLADLFILPALPLILPQFMPPLGSRRLNPAGFRIASGGICPIAVPSRSCTSFFPVCGSAAAGSLNETLQKPRCPLPGLASTLPQKPVWTHPVFWLVLSLFGGVAVVDRKSTRLNSSHLVISYAVFC